MPSRRPTTASTGSTRVLRRAVSPVGGIRRSTSSHSLFSGAPLRSPVQREARPSTPALARPKAAPAPSSAATPAPSLGARRPISAHKSPPHGPPQSHADALELEVSLTEGLREVRSRDLDAEARNARGADPEREPGHAAAAMTPAKMRIYEQLFDAIIERDKVFGGLLRKVKSAYSAYLATSPAHADASALARSGDNEAITAANAELKAENAALKGLVERLHRELQLSRAAGSDPLARTAPDRVSSATAERLAQTLPPPVPAPLQP